MFEEKLLINLFVVSHYSLNVFDRILMFISIDQMYLSYPLLNNKITKTLHTYLLNKSQKISLSLSSFSLFLHQPSSITLLHPSPKPHHPPHHPPIKPGIHINLNHPIKINPILHPIGLNHNLILLLIHQKLPIPFIDNLLALLVIVLKPIVQVHLPH